MLRCVLVAVVTVVAATSVAQARQADRAAARTGPAPDAPRASGGGPATGDRDDAKADRPDGGGGPTDVLHGVKGPPGPNGEVLTIDSKGITLRYPDDAATLRIGGRLHLDYGGAGTRALDNAFTDDFAVRRSWIESYLTLGKSLELAFQYDLSDPTTPINDAAIAYRGFEPFVVTVGNFKEPFSLNQLMSNNNLLFTERSLADAFVPARNFGGAVGANGERWTVTAGVFGGNINTGIDRGGTAGTARATYAPILAEREVLHLGIAGSVRALDRARPSVSISTNPEAFLFSTSLADTDTITDAASINRLGLEAAYQLGTVRVQAEYIRTEVDRTGGRPGLSFQGGYVEAGWVVNGRGRAYHVKPDYGATYAVFGGVDVAEGQRVTRGGIGVFELGARFSAIDLDDRTVRGGREWNATVGLNWYPEKNVKVMADYVRAHAAPASAALDRRRVDADIFIGRLQFYW